ncbi:MAG: hypothetical protein HYT11_01875 [Candidatus Levybacteria bacterium]|nr:hypothetical protein [Candidatus Levybacteria bacterium]
MGSSKSWGALAIIVFAISALGLGSAGVFATQSVPQVISSQVFNDVPPDRDGDGWPDAVDECPDEVGDEVSGCPPDEPVQTQRPDQDGDFQPMECPGEIRLPDGYAGPLTSEMIQAMNIRVGSGRPRGDIVRVGTECAAWHAGLGAAAPFTVTCPREVEGFVNFLCQIGVVGESAQRLYYGTGQRINNARHITIRWMEGYGSGESVHDPCAFLETSNQWGLPSVDDPSFPFIIVEDSGFDCPGIPVGSSGDGSAGGNDASLTSLNCDSARAVASMFPGTKASNWSPEGTYPHGWVYRGPAVKLTVPDTWFRIDWDLNRFVHAGEETPRAQSQFTAWCHE